MEASSEERSGSGGGSKTSFLCRQSSTRWIPTSDQIRILRDLYYNTGLRSPSAEQIQRISARLRQYGKIEGKNVFYWFQNHKARERQKKRLTSDLPIHTSNTTTTTTKNSTAAMSPGAIRIPLACSSQGLDGSRKMGSNGSCGGGSGLMKGSFGESFMSGRGGGGEVPAVESNMGWLGFDATTMPWMSMYHNYSLEQQYVNREMETLQLFPIHSQEEEQEQEQQKVPEETSGSLSHSASNNIDEQSNYMTAFYWPGGSQKLEQEDDHHYVYNHYPHHGSGGAASLDLTLNSYYAPPRST